MSYKFGIGKFRVQPLFCLLVWVLCWTLPAVTKAAQVTLAWDPSREADVAGYRVYYGIRSGDYYSMVDARNQTSCTISNLQSGQTYYFAATAYDSQGRESAFSPEIRYTISFIDTDGDGMPDDWEIRHGLNPNFNDAQDDPDGDGLSNIDEHRAGTVPITDVDNSAPDAPGLYLPFDRDRVDISPVLETYEFYDPDADDIHSKTRWQINRAADNVCVYDVTSSLSLTTLSVPRLVLDPETSYIWKAQFIDNHGNVSQWSEPSTFTTDLDSADRDGDGIPDHQQVDAFLDLDQNGIPDTDQDDISCVNVEGGTTRIGISIREASTVLSLVALESQNPHDPSAALKKSSDRPESLIYGLINFKLEVEQPGDEAVVTIYLSEPAPLDGIWYKYDPVEENWQDYSRYTEFSDDRTAVYLTLKDGGFGDADGVANGIIVDPLGFGIPPTDGGGSDSATCFITSMAADPGDFDSSFMLWRQIRGIEVGLLFALLLGLLVGCVPRVTV